MKDFLIKSIGEVEHIHTPYGVVKPLISRKNVDGINFGVGYSELNVGAKQSLVHDYSDEVISVVSGSGEIVVDGEKESFKPGDVFFVRKGTAHQIRNTSKEAVKVVYFSTPLAPTPEEGHRYIK